MKNILFLIVLFCMVSFTFADGLINEYSYKFIGEWINKNDSEDCFMIVDSEKMVIIQDNDETITLYWEIYEEDNKMILHLINLDIVDDKTVLVENHRDPLYMVWYTYYKHLYYEINFSENDELIVIDGDDEFVLIRRD